jgi:hypothetical protein
MRWLVLGFATALACAGPAAAEDDPSRFSWFASLGLTGLADDDPYLDEDGDAAVGIWLLPNLELNYRAPAYEIEAELGADLRRYLNEASLSEEFIRARLSAEAGIWPGLTVRLSNEYEPRPRELASPGDATQNLLQTNQLDMEIRYWRELAEQREILFSMRGTHFAGDEFDADLLTDGGGVVVNDNFDPEHFEGELLAEFQSPLSLLERTAWYLRGEARYRSFSESAVTDHADLFAMLGLRTRFFRNIEIDIAAGWGVISFESRDNVQRFVGEGSLRYRLPSGWTWRVSAANRFVADLSGNNFVETTGRVSLHRYLGDATQVSGALFFSRLENDAWGTDENLFGGVEVRVTHRFGRHTEASATYRHWRNTGEYSRDDFNQNQLALEIVYRR